MAFTLSGTKITQTGGTSNNRDAPQDLIDAGIADVSQGGDKTIVIANGVDLKIDGFYDDTGWHYALSDGSRLSKGANCDWVSGAEYAGFKVGGFTASVNNLGNSWAFNEEDGGNIYWRNVAMRTRTSSRSDIYFNGDTTNYNIDGFVFDSSNGSGENTQTVFDTGIMRNIDFIRVNHSIGGTGTIENFGHSGLLENNAQNKIFPRDDNYHFVKYKPFLESDGKRVATGFGAFSATDGEKTIYFDDLDVPDFFDHTTDIVAHSGPGRIIGQRTFNVSLNDSAGDPETDVKVLIKNTSDGTDSVRASFDNEINQLVEVYNGQKTGGGGYSIPNVQKDYQIKNAYFYKYDKQINSILGIDMSAKEYTGSVFLLDDASITETDKTVTDAYTELETPQKFYDRAKSFLVDNYAGERATIVTRSGDTIDAGAYNVVIDATATSAFAFDGTTITIKASTFTGGIQTTGIVTLENGALVTGGTYNQIVFGSGFTGIVTFNDTNITQLENTTGNNLQISLTGTSTTPTTLAETNGALNIASILTVTDINGDEMKCIAWNNSDVTAGNEIKSYSSATSHQINTFGVSSVRIAVDKPGHYARIYTVPITSTQQNLVVNMTPSPSVDVSTDVSALIAATTISLSIDPYGLGFDVLSAEIDADFSAITAAQWRRYHDYFSEDVVGLTILGLNNLNGDQVYNTTESGVAILRPTLQVVPAGTREVIGGAFIDISAAVALYPGYDYTPRNAQNVAVEMATVNPLVDYNLIGEILTEALEVDTRLGEIHISAKRAGSQRLT